MKATIFQFVLLKAQLHAGMIINLDLVRKQYKISVLLSNHSGKTAGNKYRTEKFRQCHAMWI